MYGTPRNSGGNTQEVVSLGLRPLTPLGTATNPHSELFSGGDTAAGMVSSNKSGTTLGHDRDGDDDGDSGSSDGSLFGDDSGDDDEGGGGNQKKGASKANGVQAQNSGPNATRSSNHSNTGGPILSPDIVMTAYIDGQVLLWDRRNPSQSKPLRLEMGEKSPPWCVSVSPRIPNILPPCTLGRLCLLSPWANLATLVCLSLVEGCRSRPRPRPRGQSRIW